MAWLDSKLSKWKNILSNKKQRYINLKTEIQFYTFLNPSFFWLYLEKDKDVNDRAQTSEAWLQLAG